VCCVRHNTVIYASNITRNIFACTLHQQVIKHKQELLLVGDLTFESVSNFKYPRVDINQQANSHEGINYTDSSVHSWDMGINKVRR